MGESYFEFTVCLGAIIGVQECDEAIINECSEGRVCLGQSSSDSASDAKVHVLFGATDGEYFVGFDKIENRSEGIRIKGGAFVFGVG